MGYFEEIERSHYGSINLKRIIGPNLLRGLVVSAVVHCLVIAIPFALWWFFGAQKVTEKPLRVVDLSRLTKIIPEVEKPKPEPTAPSGRSGRRGGGSPGGSRSPGQFHARIQPLRFEFEEGPSPVEPRTSIPEPLLANPLPDYPLSRALPVPSPLPDVDAGSLTRESSDPIAGLPAPKSHRGGVSGAQGTADLPDIELMPYGGASSDLPGSIGGPGSGNGYGGYETGTGGDGPGSGGGRGGGEGPGTGTWGTGSGSGTAGLGRGSGGEYVPPSHATAGVSPPEPALPEPAITETALSGLLAWMRQNRGRFPTLVQSYLETRPGDLCGITSYAGWNIFIQFSEAEHQLKIFLTQSETGILLADSDFRQRSQLLGMGHVTRDASALITAIEAVREKPSRQRTDEFYRVFGDWMAARGIKMGSRAAR
ncbi:MAG: hypothetical protein NT025_03885 [bacterium]|nr:hypothetical protein [bacterium]